MDKIVKEIIDNYIIELDNYLLGHWDKLPLIKTEKQGDCYVLFIDFGDKQVSIVIQKDKSILDAMLNEVKESIVIITTLRDIFKRLNP